jgi:hypothetical protein
VALIINAIHRINLTVQFAGVATGFLAANCRESITRSISLQWQKLFINNFSFKFKKVPYLSN